MVRTTVRLATNPRSARRRSKDEGRGKRNVREYSNDNVVSLRDPKFLLNLLYCVNGILRALVVLLDWWS